MTNPSSIDKFCLCGRNFWMYWPSCGFVNGAWGFAHVPYFDLKSSNPVRIARRSYLYLSPDLHSSLIISRFISLMPKHFVIADIGQQACPIFSSFYWSWLDFWWGHLEQNDFWLFDITQGESIRCEVPALSSSIHQYQFCIDPSSWKWFLGVGGQL